MKAHPIFPSLFRLLALLSLAPWICGAAGAGYAGTMRQQSVPEALVPATTQLLLGGPVKDGGVTLEMFRLQGEGAEWSADGRWIIYDCKHKDGYYNIHVCRPDGTDDRCLTTPNNGLPHRHAGSPSWHPSMKYVAFAAEKKTHQGGSIEAIPGFGGRSDIWMMLADGSKAWQLTNTRDDRDDGVIIPKFSHDGTKLAWTERVKAPKTFQPRNWFGAWVIKVGDFVVTAAGPELRNIRTLPAGGAPGFYEAYGFSPDDKSIIFCSDFEEPSAFNSQIYVMDAASGGNVRRLTLDPRFYNEHASYSPDGRHIVWMSNRDNPNKGTDWWMMRPDGSHKQRLTYFNQAGHPESGTEAVYACLAHWAPNGMQFVGGVQYSLLKQEGRIILVTLERGLLSD